MLNFVHRFLNLPGLKPVEYVNLFELGRWTLFLGASYAFDQGEFFSKVFLYKGLQDVGGLSVWLCVFSFIFFLSLFGFIKNNITIRKIVLCFSTFLWSLLVFEAMSTDIFNDSVIVSYLLLAIVNIYTYIGLENGLK